MDNSRKPSMCVELWYNAFLIYSLPMNQSLEHIIPYHTLHPLSEKLQFPRMKLHCNAYFYIKMSAIAYKLCINIVLIEHIETLQKISRGWLYDLDTIRFFLFLGEQIYSSRVPGGQLRTCSLISIFGQ